MENFHGLLHEPLGLCLFFLPQVTALSSNHQVPKREEQEQHGKGRGRKLFCLPASANVIYIYNYVFTCIHTIPHIQTTTHIYVIHIFVRIFIQYVNIYVRMFREVYLYIHVTCMYFRSVSLQSMIYNICLQYNYTYIHTYIHLKTHDTLYARKLS